MDRGGGAIPGAGGAAGFEKLPACKRCNSSWLSWLALDPVNCGPLPRRVAWCPAIFPCEALRAWRRLGGVAELVSDIDGAAIEEDDGAAAAGGGAAAGRAGAAPVL
jgi:hypothetical protein